MGNGRTGDGGGGAAPGGTLTVLAWHNVDATWRFAARGRHVGGGLAAQLAVLRRMAYVVDLGDALVDLAAGRRLPPRAVALTFDDGYADNLRVAVPMLRSLGLPATFFVAPGFLDGSCAPWWERLAWAITTTGADVLDWDGVSRPLTDDRERHDALAAIERGLKRVPDAVRTASVDAIVRSLSPDVPFATRAAMLDWDGAAELVRGGFAVGSHSWSHAIMSNESSDVQRRDLAASRRVLQDRLGVACDLLAYPNGSVGDFTSGTEEAARRAGHTAAVTTIEGTNTAATPRFALRRFVVAADRGIVGLRRVFRSAATHALRGSVPPGRSSGRRAVRL